MNTIARVAIAVLLGVGVVVGVQQFAIHHFGATTEDIQGAGGIGVLILGGAVVGGFLKIAEKD